MKRIGRSLLSGVMFLLLGTGAAAPGPALADGGEGKKIYEAHCLSCHGVRGDGKGPRSRELSPPPPDFSDPAFWENRTDSFLFHVVQNGLGSMPGWSETLSPGSIEDVLSYLRTFRR
ncbi:MAG: cytochrome c [Nitrospirae bacterium]|nr:MAG: Cytochrome c, class I [Leptospirillum sp. Group IV 'UBA BS']MCL4484896.1 cytochrome c [Nitrospirota bacterium]MCL5284525.1 cytochrome c [Nitrospirota bacterium]